MQEADLMSDLHAANTPTVVISKAFLFCRFRFWPLKVYALRGGDSKEGGVSPGPEMDLDLEPSWNISGPNITNSSGSPPSHLQMALFTDGTAVALMVVLGLVTFLTAFVNSAVIVAVCTTKKLHQPANYLICSLAVTDFLVALLVMPISLLYITMESWFLGQVVCDLWLCVDMTCCTCSILHLCIIALDRYWAITKAIEYARKRSARRAAVMVGVVWLTSVFISMPPLFWRRRPSSGSLQHCVIEHDHLGYTIYSTFGAFYIPMFVILILYYRIYRAAKTLYQKRSASLNLSSRRMGSQNSMENRVSHTICLSDLSNSDPTVATSQLGATANISCSETEMNGHDAKNQTCSSRERKAACILGLILGAFIFCWLPFFLKELMVGLQVLQPPPLLSVALTWLGYINSLINPLLYTSFNDDFKLAFKKLLKRKEDV